MNEFELDFRCLICLQIPRDPHLCRHCTRPYCQTCVRTLYDIYGDECCPHCRYDAFEQSFIVVRKNNFVTCVHQTIVYNNRSNLYICNSHVQGGHCAWWLHSRTLSGYPVWRFPVRDPSLREAWRLSPDDFLWRLQRRGLQQLLEVRYFVLRWGRMKMLMVCFVVWFVLLYM